MKTAQNPDGGNHIGFESATAAKSLCLSAKYERCLRNLEKELEIVTSTPKSSKSIMDVSFPRCFREACQGDSSAGLVFDNDSGYVSTNPESNMECPSVNMGDVSAPKPIYLSEDALLEKPETCQQRQQQEEEYGHLFFLTDSVVPASCESEKTNFSGFEEDESGVEKDISNQSEIIPVISPVKVCVNGEEVADNSEKPGSPKNDTTCDRTPEKSYRNPMNSDISPDLFSEDDEPNENVVLYHSLTEKYAHTNDQKLIKRVQQGLSGVYPPTSVTIIQMSVREMLDRINENKHLFADGSSGSGAVEKKSLLIAETSERALCEKWPKILERRCHGLL